MKRARPHRDGRRPRAAAPPSGGAGGGVRKEAERSVVLTNRYGLHMRPAKQVVELANSFPCDISLISNGHDADAKSILSVIGLGAECGDEVVVRSRGERAGEAAEALGSMLASLPELYGEPEDTEAGPKIAQRSGSPKADGGAPPPRRRGSRASVSGRKRRAGGEDNS